MSLMDYPTTYDYPLNKENNYWKATLRIGLEDIQDLSRNAFRVCGNNAYFHLWAQSHLQGHVRRALGLGVSDMFLTCPGQTRLLTYMMVSSGAKGILYFYAKAFTDRLLGIGRRNELALVWHELGPFEDLIASDHREKPISVSRPDVEAVTFSRDDETLLLLIKHGKQYHRYVSDGAVETVTVKLRTDNNRGMKAWRAGYPDVTPINVAAEGNDVLRLRVDGFDLTDIILIASNRERVRSLSAHRRQTLPLAAKWAWQVCRDKKVKTEVTLKSIANAGGQIPQQVRQLQDEAAREFSAALAARMRGDFAASYRAFRTLLETYRTIQKIMVVEAEALWAERKSPTTAEKFLNMYFTLPSFYSVLRGGKPLRPNTLGNLILKALANARADTTENVP